MIDIMGVQAVYEDMEARRRSQGKLNRLMESARKNRENRVKYYAESEVKREELRKYIEPKPTEDMSIRRHFESDGDLEALFGVVK